MERTPSKHHPRGGLARGDLERLVAQHLTVREIAAAVDRSFTTVRYWLRQYGLETTREARTKRARGTESQPRFEDDCPKHGRTVYARRRNGAAQCLRCRADAVSEWRRRAKRLLVDEAGGACLLCGFDAYAGALHFHHVDPAQKRFGLGSRGLAKSIEALREEARKCVLLCSNCHAQVEAGVLALP
jgi:transposase-like protein